MKRHVIVIVSLLLIGSILHLLFTQPNSTVMKMTKDPNNLIRLHVLANSDSEEDQTLKYKVRDVIVEYLTPKFNNSSNINESRKILLANLPEIEKIALEKLNVEGSNYSVEAQYGWFNFPIKSYGTFVLPAGNYEAVRIVIGEGKGANWWCVLFPPLCFVDVSKKTVQESKNIIRLENVNKQNDIKQISTSFKIVEILENSINNFSKMIANM